MNNDSTTPNPAPILHVGRNRDDLNRQIVNHILAVPHTAIYVFSYDHANKRTLHTLRAGDYSDLEQRLGTSGTRRIELIVNGQTIPLLEPIRCCR